jgi:hypothetical protein
MLKHLLFGVFDAITVSFGAAIALVIAEPGKTAGIVLLVVSFFGVVFTSASRNAADAYFSRRSDA